MRLCRLLLALAVALVLALTFGTPLGAPSLSRVMTLLVSDSGPPLFAAAIPASPAEVLLKCLARFADKSESEVEVRPILRA